MSRVVLLAHEGVPCAVVAKQVVRASRDDASEPISLFGVGGGSERRGLVVRTGAGERWLPCSGAEIGNLAEDSLVPMPELLSDVLRRPWVVGLAARGDEIVWLVDLERWGAEATPRADG